MKMYYKQVMCESSVLGKYIKIIWHFSLYNFMYVQIVCNLRHKFIMALDLVNYFRHILCKYF